ncbi:MAG: ABC transporter permease subunit [Pseudomonadota bacterium]|uniref:Peptide ABC transporter permease n=1 Tax=Alteromonas alba TaxID=2079529 RepID=A0A2S9VBA3_9ALTE|nr:ABC transporter permease subunit [Alteromonas alba]MAJ68745.1 peptide ABC transporter permease [Alteromonadaceae bacterium]MBR9793893.1 ABC transporter permease subunit [Gammaproteobacteria bacterium]MCP4863816.1 ABC transporter permease subunit [Alteromonas sp.]MDY6927348.1 ABC transporter permease subunit [Pseudomonadota bacterium]RPH17634.1 MAG: ABC transporter permease subunit [Alteromonadaceae bacterium TMED7]
MSRFSLYDDEAHPSPWQHTWRAFKSSHIALVGLAVLLLFVFFAFFAPLVAPYNPTYQNTEALLIPPSWAPNGSIAHLFGTDALGRDLFSRIMYGCRVTFGTSLLVVIIAMLVGVTIGTIAGMLSGVRSSVVNHLLDALMAIPTLLIAIIIVGILGSGLVNSMWAITLALIPQFVHHTRSFVRGEMKKDYIQSSTLDGASNLQLFYYSILPNMIEMLVVQGTLALSIAVIDISALGFLNLGAQAPLPELGAILATGLDAGYLAPWNIAIPGVSIFLMVLSITIVGDGLRSALRKRVNR